MYHELKSLLDQLSDEQRQYLNQQLKNWGGADSNAICNHLHYLRFGELGQFNPFNKKLYKELVTDLADHIEIDWVTLTKTQTWDELNAEQIESAIVAKLFENIWSKLSEEDKRRIIAESDKNDDINLSSIFTTGGGIIAANLGGFQTYILASTILSGIGSAVGATIPFAIYAGLSKAISIVIGPIGWTGLAVATIFKLSQPKWDKLIQAILLISLFRNSPK